MYTVVAAGETLRVPVAARLPSGSINTLETPCTFQVRVADCPAVIVEGITSKVSTAGAAQAGIDKAITKAISRVNHLISSSL